MVNPLSDNKPPQVYELMFNYYKELSELQARHHQELLEERKIERAMHNRQLLRLVEREAELVIFEQTCINFVINHPVHAREFRRVIPEVVNEIVDESEEEDDDEMFNDDDPVIEQAVEQLREVRRRLNFEDL